MQENQEYSLQDLWDFLIENEDITITVDVGKVDYIRRGISKIKHREKAKLGEFGDDDQKFTSHPLPQTADEKAENLCRLRLSLHTKEGFDVHKVQVNNINDLSNTN